MMSFRLRNHGLSEVPFSLPARVTRRVRICSSREKTGAADLILDAGSLAGGAGSTVVDATGEKPVILRQGAVPGDLIESVLAPD